MLQTYEQKSKIKLTTTVLTIIVVAGLVLLSDHLKATKSSSLALTSKTPSGSTTQPISSQSSATSTSTASSSATSATSSGYKDGTYTATSDYYVPHGDESIQVSLTLKDGAIADASIQNSETDPTSAEFQGQFASEYKSYVVGKKINSLNLNVIAGASDTTQAFSDAANQIASKAQS